ncbi:uncharacterized protein IUM83_05059 [Phytophthora cinnamomi]|uniref:uncharacterized protein n=1 Tax=Phytophthora cinnamomi TaxID=4785 RepID=UPI00355970F8|nr:hypothetical protein IUM83_05059 [Phytophthora cinnamomi]
MAAKNARALQALALETLEASDDEVLGWPDRPSSSSSPSSSQGVEPSGASDSAGSPTAPGQSSLTSASVPANQKDEELEDKPPAPSAAVATAVPTAAAQVSSAPSSPPVPSGTKRARPISPRVASKKARSSKPAAAKSPAKPAVLSVTKSAAKVTAKSTVKVAPKSAAKPTGKGTAKSAARQLLRSKLSDTAFFLAPDLLRQVRSRPSTPKSAPPVEIVAECWLKSRGDRPDFVKVFIVSTSACTGSWTQVSFWVYIADLNLGRPIAELALCFQLWQQYSHERKRRGDALRPILAELYGTLHKAAVAFDPTDNEPVPDLDPELYFDPSVPFAPPAKLPWFPEKTDWALGSVDIDHEEPWRTWWPHDPATHPYIECFLALNQEFPVFASADFATEQAQRTTVEDIASAESALPICSPNAPSPVKRGELVIFDNVLDDSDSEHDATDDAGALVVL